VLPNGTQKASGQANGGEHLVQFGSFQSPWDCPRLQQAALARRPDDDRHHSAAHFTWQFAVNGRRGVVNPDVSIPLRDAGFEARQVKSMMKVVVPAALAFVRSLKARNGTLPRRLRKGPFPCGLAISTRKSAPEAKVKKNRSEKIAKEPSP
jgi:hypothetical protein